MRCFPDKKGKLTLQFVISEKLVDINISILYINIQYQVKTEYMRAYNFFRVSAKGFHNLNIFISLKTTE